MTESHTLTVENLELGYGGRTVVESLDLAVPPGKITTIVGANACGKSTLLRSMFAATQSPKWSCSPGRQGCSSPTREEARSHARSAAAVTDRTGRDSCRRSRRPRPTSTSAGCCRGGVARMTPPSPRRLRQRTQPDWPNDRWTSFPVVSANVVWIAMALAQQTDLLLLDEPTTFLDVSHQVEVLDLLTDLNRTRGTTIVMVLHDLNLAARYADFLVAMADRRVYAAGDPAGVLTSDNVRTVFGLESRIIPDPISGKPLVLPLGRHHVPRRRVDVTASNAPGGRIESVEQLNAILGQPHPTIMEKQTAYTTPLIREFIEQARFLCLRHPMRLEIATARRVATWSVRFCFLTRRRSCSRIVRATGAPTRTGT